MRTETREVLVEQEVYIAEDGKEFDNEDDCHSHEMTIMERELKLYNTKFQRSNLDRCWYAVLENEDDVKRFIELCNYDGITLQGITKPGVYMYNDRQWVPISELCDTLTNLAKENTNDN